MLSIEQALAALMDAVAAQPIESCPLRKTHGRILAEPVRAGHDSPPFDTSAMDGFAVRCADLEAASTGSPAVIPLQGEIAAGASGLLTLEPGKVLRINTGAPLPQGADAVVRVEDAQLTSEAVRFVAPITEGTAIRRASEDYKSGKLMLQPGRRIDPPALGLLASLGQAAVKVHRRPRVALLTSGDEIIDPGSPLGFGQIYDSNRYALLPLLESFGAEMIDLGRVADTPEAVRASLERGFECDVLITTGGVSMGSRDLIRPMLLDLGAEEIFWKVKQRPGMPLFVAKRQSPNAASASTLCFGLPGNPVSVFVTALIYVRAALFRMQGAADCELPWRRAIAAAEFKKNPGLTHFARATLQEKNSATPRLLPSPGQGSHQMSALASADGLVRLEENSSGARAEEPLDFLDFSLLF